MQHVPPPSVATKGLRRYTHRGLYTQHRGYITCFISPTYVFAHPKYLKTRYMSTPAAWRGWSAQYSHKTSTPNTLALVSILYSLNTLFPV